MTIGVEAYSSEQEEKVKLLAILLDGCDVYIKRKSRE